MGFLEGAKAGRFRGLTSFFGGDYSRAIFVFFKYILEVIGGG